MPERLDGSIFHPPSRSLASPSRGRLGGDQPPRPPSPSFSIPSLAVLMLLVFLNPTSSSLLNSELICRSYGSFGFLAVVPRPERQYRLSPQAVVPLSKAVVPPMAISGSTATVPRWYRLDFGSCIFRVEFCSSCTAVRHGSSTYKR